MKINSNKASRIIIKISVTSNFNARAISSLQHGAGVLPGPGVTPVPEQLAVGEQCHTFRCRGIVLTYSPLEVWTADGRDRDVESAMFQLKSLLHVDALCRNSVHGAQTVIIPLVITIPHLETDRPVMRINDK